MSLINLSLHLPAAESHAAHQRSHTGSSQYDLHTVCFIRGVIFKLSDESLSDDIWSAPHDALYVYG